MAYARPALFHAFAKDAANLLVGVGPNRPRKAWSHIYRSLQHGDAKTACEAVRNLSFPATIVTCAEAFVTLQQERHDADYRVLPADALKQSCPAGPTNGQRPLRPLSMLSCQTTAHRTVSFDPFRTHCPSVRLQHPAQRARHDVGGSPSGWPLPRGNRKNSSTNCTRV